MEGKGYWGIVLTKLYCYIVCIYKYKTVCIQPLYTTIELKNGEKRNIY